MFASTTRHRERAGYWSGYCESLGRQRAASQTLFLPQGARKTRQPIVLVSACHSRKSRLFSWNAEKGGRGCGREGHGMFTTGGEDTWDPKGHKGVADSTERKV